MSEFGKLNRRDALHLPVVTAVGGALLAPHSATAAPTKQGPWGEKLKAALVWVKDPVEIMIGGGSRQRIKTDQHAAFVKDFTLSALPKTALIHLFAFTRYELYVNGAYVARGPARFELTRQEYDTHDLLKHLKSGQNRIAVRVHRDAPTGRIRDADPGFCCAIVLKEKAGETKTIMSGPDWAARPDLGFGKRQGAWSSIEERYDATKESVWWEPAYDISSWPKAVAVSYPKAELVARETALLVELPMAVKAQAPDRYLEAGESFVFDMKDGVVLAYPLFTLEADEGSEIEIVFGLPQNATAGKSSYIAKAGSQSWRLSDTYCFSHISLSVKSGRVKISDLKVFEVRYPFSRIGQFSCSDEVLNRVWALSVRSLELLSEDAYTDCADRERVEWMDNCPPGYELTKVAMSAPASDEKPLYGDPRLFKAIIRRTALTQLPDGMMKAHTCSERWDIHAIMEDRACDWAIQLKHYVDHTDDVEFARDMWPYGLRLMDSFLRQKTKNGLVNVREWVDWANPLRYQTCEGAGINAFVIRAMNDLSAIGQRIGQKSEAARLKKEAALMASAFNDHLWDEASGSYFSGLWGEQSKRVGVFGGKVFDWPVDDKGRTRPTAHAALFALYCDLVPKDRRAKVIDYVLKNFGNQYQIMVYFFYYQMLYGLDDPQYDKMVCDSIRSKWAEMAKSEWLTSWEGFGSKGSARVHIYGIMPASFLATHILGVQEMRRAEKTVLIAPRFSGLTHAKGVVATAHGPVTVEWSNADGLITVDIDLPAGLDAQFKLLVPVNAATAHNGKKISFPTIEGLGDKPFPFMTKLKSGKHQLRFNSAANALKSS